MEPALETGANQLAQIIAPLEFGPSNKFTSQLPLRCTKSPVASPLKAGLLLLDTPTADTKSGSSLQISWETLGLQLRESATRKSTTINGHVQTNCNLERFFDLFVSDNAKYSVCTWTVPGESTHSSLDSSHANDHNHDFCRDHHCCRRRHCASTLLQWWIHYPVVCLHPCRYKTCRNDCALRMRP
jgi:hypothetical protein